MDSGGWMRCHEVCSALHVNMNELCSLVYSIQKQEKVRVQLVGCVAVRPGAIPTIPPHEY